MAYHLLDLVVSVYQTPHTEMHTCMFSIQDGDLIVKRGSLEGKDPIDLYYLVLAKWIAWTHIYFGEEPSEIPVTQVEKFSQLPLPIETTER